MTQPNNQTASPAPQVAAVGLHAVVSRLPTCKGTNCGCTDGVSHSTECRAEYEAATAMPYDEQWLHEPDDGRGWKCHVCKYGGSANNGANVFCANCHRHK
jgi:hypothetical protein